MSSSAKKTSKPKNQNVAFIDNRAVPCRATLGQLQAMFPSGVAGLVSNTSGDYVFPGDDGSLTLEPQEQYSIITHSVPSTPTGQPQGGGFGGTQQLSGNLTGATQNNFLGLSAAAAAQQSLHKSIASTPIPHHPILEEEFGDDIFSSPQVPTQLMGRGKLILDRVHDHIMLPPLLFDIIDTMEFQRLRSLKQLGTTVYLYPGATHTRFEHSIGVAHLAGLMIKKIARRQPELQVTEADVLCVQVAGLCHDLGHGPFSHLFEDIVNRIRKDRGEAKEWHHEEMSVILLRRILAKLNLTNYGMTEEDANMIELLINGLKPGDAWPANVGRPATKRFMVDIVANKRNGIDVDKLDYFLRDSLCCYGRPTVDCHVPRLLASCRAIVVDGESQICYEEKLALSLGDIFTLRAKLHKYAYQHRVVKVIDHMISDILREADAFFRVKGSDGSAVKISDAVLDVDGFCSLGDWILQAMDASTEPGMAAAQQIIARLNERNLYSVAGHAQFARHQYQTTRDSIKEELLAFVPSEHHAGLTKALIIEFTKITYGSSDSSGNPDDPINHVSFYNPKTRPNHAHKLPSARLSPLFSPMEFCEKSVVVMVRDDTYLEIAVQAFEKWKQSHMRHLQVAVPVYNFSPSRPMLKKRERGGSTTMNPSGNEQASGLVLSAVTGGSSAAKLSAPVFSGAANNNLVTTTGTTAAGGVSASKHDGEDGAPMPSGVRDGRL